MPVDGARAGDVPRLEARHISKTFGRRTVLSDVSLTVLPGEMHGIVGQNGSGKSTFTKAISGYHAPDSGGEILVNGEPLRLPVRPSDLRKAGGSVVHQDLGLIDEATVVENIRIAVMQGQRWSRRVDWKREGKAATEALARLGYRGSPHELVSGLTPADRARVAIGRAIQGHAVGGGLIIFDESTRALPADALDDFYATVRTLRDEGTAIVIIGHRLGEILAECDRVTVLRDGRCAASGVPTEGLSESDLASRMLGHAVKHLDVSDANKADRRKGQTTIQIRNLRGSGITAPLDLDLHRGEILGITGLPGSGFESIPYLLAGAHSGAGTVNLGGELLDLSVLPLAKIAAAGVVLVPENRTKEGLGMTQTVLENVSLPWLSQRGRRWYTGKGWQREQANEVIRSLGVVPPNPDQIVARLSGGNAQKVLLGKWLSGAPKLVLLHEPTQGVDVQARVDLLRAVRLAAEQGAGVLVATTEPEDLVTICDRVLFFRDGRPADELRFPFDSATIISTIYPSDIKQSSGPHDSDLERKIRNAQ
jgi:ribose transport system ATP-binding protein